MRRARRPSESEFRIRIRGARQACSPFEAEVAGRLRAILARVAVDLPLSLAASACGPTPAATAAGVRRAHREALAYCAAFVKFNSAALPEAIASHRRNVTPNYRKVIPDSGNVTRDGGSARQ